MKQIIVLYHNDHDGFGAAWTAWKKFGDKADYFPIQYKGREDILPKGLKNKEIYLVDLCFSANTMKRLLEENKKVVVIDHHIGRKEEVKISSDYLFDIKHSAAVLSWKYFYPRKKIPQLLKVIEDMDIWKFKISHTRELLASLDTHSFNFLKWNKIANDFENARKRKKYINEGRAIVKYQDNLIKKIVEYGEKAVFEGHQVFVVNSPILESELGNYVSKNKKIIGLVWSYRKGLFKGSLRNEGKVNLSDLAKKYGGGGHKAAAGFTFNAEIKLPWKKIK
ncbi:MAG: DHHA1 domain-containing protein [Patescibacteria group bacterium]